MDGDALNPIDRLARTNIERGSARLDRALEGLDPYESLRQIASGVVWTPRPALVDELLDVYGRLVELQRQYPDEGIPALSQMVHDLVESIMSLGLPMVVQPRDRLAAAKELLSRSPDFANPIKSVAVSSMDDIRHRPPTEAEITEAERLCARLYGPLSEIDGYITAAVAAATAKAEAEDRDTDQ